MPSKIRTSPFIQAQRVKEYKDIDLDFRPHPLTGDIGVLSSIDAAKAAIRNIILTKYGERVFQYTFGSRVNSLLFENFNTLTLVGMREEITNAIKTSDERIFLYNDGVRIVPVEEENRLIISITFGLRNIPDKKIDFSFYLERVR
jgi:phage baseplate assembly protein W